MAGQHSLRTNAAELLVVSISIFPVRAPRKLEGVVDLLYELDEYTRRQSRLRDWVKEPAACGQAAATPPRTQTAEQHFGTAVKWSQARY